MTEHAHDDAAVAEELRAHHRVMMSELDELTTELLEAARTGGDATTARAALEHWISEVLVPHAAEEEASTYLSAGDLPEGRLLIESMLMEHGLIRRTAANVTSAPDVLEAAVQGRQLFDLFESHQQKENDLILPLLVDASDVSLGEVMEKVHGHHDGHHHHHH